MSILIGNLVLEAKEDKGSYYRVRLKVKRIAKEKEQGEVSRDGGCVMLVGMLTGIL